MIKIANAPCSWGVLEFDRTATSADSHSVLAEMQATGYAGTELGDWGFLPTDPAELRRTLQTYALELVGAFVPVRLADRSAHHAGIEQGVKTAELMYRAGYQAAFVILADANGSVPQRVAAAGRATADLALDRDGWQALRDGAHRFAQQVHAACGLRTLFHHHCAGYVETPGEIEKLLAMTDPDTLGLVLDTGHYQFGGGYPEAALQLFGDRIGHVHYKDCSAAVAQAARSAGWDYFTALSEGVFCELGRGSVDFTAVTEALRTRGYDGWIVVEQDVLPGMGSPKACAGRNREYLRSLGL